MKKGDENMHIRFKWYNEHPCHFFAIIEVSPEALS